MKSVFLSGGAREQALSYLLHKGEDVIAVVTPRPSESNRRFEKVVTTAIENDIPVISVDRHDVATKLAELQFDLLISCGFPFILGADVLSCVQHAINVHPTLLPKYRGPRSGAFVVMNGETETGVTVHRITEGTDDGDILEQARIPVSPFDTTKSLYRKCRDLEPKLLYRVVCRLRSGTQTSAPQDESEATIYPQIRVPKDSEIDPRKTMLELWNEIRACDPDDYPAFFVIHGQKVCIRLWRPEKPEDEFDLI